MPKYEPLDLRALAKSLDGFNSVAQNLANQMKSFQGQSILQSLQPALQSISKLQEPSSFEKMAQSLGAVQQQLESRGYTSLVAQIQDSLKKNTSLLAGIKPSGLASIQSQLRDIGERYASIASIIRPPTYAIALERTLLPAIRSIQGETHNVPQTVQSEVSTEAGELVAWNWEPLLDQLRTMSTSDIVKLLSILWQVVLTYIAIIGYFGGLETEQRDYQMLENDRQAAEERKEIVSAVQEVEDAQHLSQDLLLQLRDSVAAIHEAQEAILAELNKRQIFVISRRVGLRLEPKQRISVVTMISRNQLVEVIETKGEWKRVSFQDHTEGISYEGWVKSKYILSRSVK